MRRPYDWRVEVSRVESFGLFLTTRCGSCGAAEAHAARPNCRETGNHSPTADDQPCERCVFIPTPDGKCICREVGK